MKNPHDRFARERSRKPPEDDAPSVEIPTLLFTRFVCPSCGNGPIQVFDNDLDNVRVKCACGKVYHHEDIEAIMFPHGPTSLLRERLKKSESRRNRPRRSGLPKKKKRMHQEVPSDGLIEFAHGQVRNPFRR